VPKIPRDISGRKLAKGRLESELKKEFAFFLYKKGGES